MAQYNRKHAQQNETKLVEGHEVSSKEDLKDRIECYFENINKTPGIFKWKYKMVFKRCHICRYENCGFGLIVTNNTSKKNGVKKLTGEDLIYTYRNKDQIEQAFKDVKSFINIQPFNVWEPKHVRAHYTIYMLSHLMNITIINHLRDENVDTKSSQRVYKILRDSIIGELSLKETGEDSVTLAQGR
jgi:transposase